MSNDNHAADMPPSVAAIVNIGYATWANDDIDATLRAKFDERRIPVAGVRHVRVWGIQVDDERELPGLERTQIPDEEIWELTLVSADGSNYGFDSRLLRPAT